MNNRTYEEQLDFVVSDIEALKAAAKKPLPYEQVKFSIRDVIINEILALVIGLEEKILATDSDGNVKMNKNGKPKVDWLKVIGQLGFIIGRIVGVIIESKKVK